MNNKVSIIIPCYNQTDLLERNLHYLKRQSGLDFNIIIIDDNSTEDYKEVIAKFPDLNISYIKNDVNLGAIGNIFNTIFYKTNAEYKISLHEDDVLHPQYLKKAVNILEENKKVVFVCTIANWFKNEQELKKKATESRDISKFKLLDKADFVREILNGKHIMLGSVVYRENLIDQKPELEKYNVLCDRPFLISLIKNGLVGLIEDKAIFTRDHGEDDNRFKDITEENCLNLMDFYKESLPKPTDSEDLKRLLTFSTNNLLNTYPDIKNKKESFAKFFKEGKKLGLIDLKYINKIGLLGFTKLCFGARRINKLVRWIKK